MKKLLLFCSLFLLGVACNNEEIVEPTAPQKVEFEKEQTPEPFQVSAEKALARAEKILSRGETRSTPRVVKSCEYFVAKPATRSMADTIEVAFHLINYEDNAGFAMVAADERATDIYAYSDEGQLTAEDFETNPGLAVYKGIAVKGYQFEVANPANIGPVELTPNPGNGPYGDIPLLMIGMGPDGSYYHIRNVDRSTTVGPLLNTAWGQNFPYNYYCSGNKAGCGPIAMAQIMAFHRYPPVVDGRTMDWDMVEQNYNITQDEVTDTTPILWDDVSYLIYRVGMRADVNYGTSSTTIRNGKIDNTFREFGYDCTHRQSFKEETFLSHINQSLPICMLANEEFLHLGDGHVWVVDGYNLNAVYSTYYYTEPPYEKAFSGYSSWSVLFHINWGWEGTNNGYYHLPDGVNYDEHVRAIYEIYPAEYL